MSTFECLRSTLWLYRARYAQRSHHLSAAWGAPPSPGADKEVWRHQRAEENGCQAFPTYDLCHHPNLCEVVSEHYLIHKLSFHQYTHAQQVFCVSRLVQKAELTRLSHTFLHVPQLHWIVVEDSPHKTPLVTDFLKKSGLTYTHLHMPTAKDRKLQEVA